MNILEQFTQENIIKNLSSYEVYYQVALGSLINETKAVKVDSNVDFKEALGSIFELIHDLKCLDNANEIYESELRKQAAMDAVQNFVNENLELVKTGAFDVEPIINKINDNLFFKVQMLEICEKEKEVHSQKWKEIITKEIAIQIQDSIRQL